MGCCGLRAKDECGLVMMKGLMAQMRGPGIRAVEVGGRWKMEEGRWKERKSESEKAGNQPVTDSTNGKNSGWDLPHKPKTQKGCNQLLRLSLIFPIAMGH
jgi:hypothetical protein